LFTLHNLLGKKLNIKARAKCLGFFCAFLAYFLFVSLLQLISISIYNTINKKHILENDLSTFFFVAHERIFYEK